MSYKVLLTVDLNSVNTVQRQRFYDEMKNRNFIKTDLTTTWIARYTEGVTYQYAVTECKNEIKECIQLAGIRDYEFMMMISENEVISK